MATYLMQLSYTPESWAVQLKNPQNRVEVVRPFFERLGARFEAAYLAFGKYDLVFIMEAVITHSAKKCISHSDKYPIIGVAFSHVLYTQQLMYANIAILA